MSVLVNIVLEILDRKTSEDKEINNIQIGKEGGKLLLFTDDMILYMNNSKESTQKILVELKNKFRKLKDTKSTIKTHLYFCTLIMHSLKEN